MRKTRFIENCRCYHLISRLYPPAVRLLAKRGAMRGAHQAFFLDDDEKSRRGYAFIYGNGDWETIRACHEKSMREAMGASQGRRHSQQHPFQSLLPFPVAGERHHCPNRSRSSAVAPAEVLPDMSYYISDTMSISYDPRPRSLVRHVRGASRRVSATWAEGLLSAEWTRLWARSPLSDHQAGSAAKVSAKCSAGIG